MTLALERRGWAVMLLALLVTLAGPAGYAIAQEEDAPAAEETAEAPAEEEAAPAEEEEPAAEPEEEAAADEGEENEEDAVSTDPADPLAYAFNTAILFLCAVLVFLMQAGFAMVEAGFNSSKNAVNILFKNSMDICVGVLLFFAIGFGLMYPGLYSDPGYMKEGWLGFGGTGLTEYVIDPERAYSSEVDWLFQAVFAATAATIVSGAVAGRMKVSGYLIYSAILTGLIYPISGYWKWGGGWLAEMGFQDFAGSAVVHGIGGFAGLAGAIVLGPRLGRYVDDKSVPMPGHNIPLAGLGVFILWFGWYGFNPGSMLGFADVESIEGTMHCAVTTTLAAGAGGIVATLLSWVMFGKPDLSMGLNGILAGLVSITACCDCMGLWQSILVGAIGGVLVVAGIMLLDKLKIDDPVGAWPVHGLCGIWGCLAIGIIPNGYLEVDPETGEATTSLAIQACGAFSICAWGFFTMLLLFTILKGAGLLRVSPEEEQQGLDISEHGMAAYTH